MNRKILIVFLIYLIIICASFGGQDVLELADKFAMRPDEYIFPRSVEIPEVAIMPNDKDELNGIFLQTPVRIGKDNKNTLYIVDQRRHTIFNFDSAGNYLRNIGQHGQGPGEMVQPRHIIVDGKRIITGDIGNMRIQFLDHSGRYLKSFKVIKSYESIASGNNGCVYCIPTAATLKNHLVEVYSEDGKLVKTFGELIKLGADQNMLNRAKLAISDKQQIYVAFVFFPIVRIYTAEGVLLKEIHLDIPLMIAKEKLNYRMNALRSPQKQVPYWMVSDSIKIGKDRIYLSTVYPRLEITSLSENGEVKDIFTKEWGFKEYMISYDFEVIETPQKTIFYILEDYPLSRVHILESRAN